MAIWVPWARVLMVGDYLSPLEIPWVHGSFDAYLATLNRLEPLVAEGEHVVPGHGPPAGGARPPPAPRRPPRRRDPARGPHVPAGAARVRRRREAAARAAQRPAAEDPR